MVPLQPRHVLAEALADGFGGVAAAGVEEGLELLEAGAFFGDPLAGEPAAFDFGKQFAHGVAHPIIKLRVISTPK